MNKVTIPIFFTIDNGYAPYLDVAINSIIDNASKNYEYKIIVLYQELSQENRKKIADKSAENFEISFVYM